MRLLYVLAGIISFLAALLFTLPPENALAWWGDDLDVEVRLYSPRGGLAVGTAAAVSIDGLRLDETHWRLRPVSLLKGRLGFKLDSRIAAEPAQAVVEFGLGGRSVIYGLKASIQMQSLLPMLGGLILPVEGTIQADLQRLDFRGEQLSDIEGRIQVSGIAMSFLRPPLALGSYEAELTSSEGLLTATVKEMQGSVIEATGSITLDPDNRYQVDLSLRPLPGSEERLHNQLKVHARRDSQGWYRMKMQGQL